MRKQRVLINKERKEIIVLESVNAVDEKKIAGSSCQTSKKTIKIIFKIKD